MLEADGACFHGPAWDNTPEYPDTESKLLQSDMDEALALIAQLEALRSQMADDEAAVHASQLASNLRQDTVRLLRNVGTYLECELSVDCRIAAAKALTSKVSALLARLAQAHNPFRLFLQTTTDANAEKYLKAEHTAPERFSLMQDRLLRDYALSLPEEDLIVALGIDGHAAWGTLYDNLSGSVRAEVDLPDGKKAMGLAEVASLGQSESEAVRRAAWKATAAAWERNEEAVAAGLNALAGWRLIVSNRRSHKKPLHFLDMPLHQGRICRETLNAMLGAVDEARHLGRRSLKARAKLLGKQTMAPWDLSAPCPGSAVGTKKQTVSSPGSMDGYSLVGNRLCSLHNRRWRSRRECSAGVSLLSEAGKRSVNRACRS